MLAAAPQDAVDRVVTSCISLYHHAANRLRMPAAIVAILIAALTL